MKNRSPVVGMPNRWLYECAISSVAFFVAAYMLSGWSTLSCTENGMFVLAPYTELDDA